MLEKYDEVRVWYTSLSEIEKKVFNSIVHSQLEKDECEEIGSSDFSIKKLEVYQEFKESGCDSVLYFGQYMR